MPGALSLVRRRPPSQPYRPDDPAVHYRHDNQLTEQRGVTLMAAFAAHPQRFKGSRTQIT